MTQSAPIPDMCIFQPTEVLKNEIVAPIVTEIEAKINIEEDDLQPAWLSELQSVDRLLINRKFAVRGAMMLQGKKNHFEVRTEDQTLVYNIEEENRWWVGYLLYGLRPLQLRITSSGGEEVLRLIRPFACTSRILPCQLQRMQVLGPGSRILGSVEQVWSAVVPAYVVKDHDGNKLFCIQGPRVTMNWYSSQKFSISRPASTPAVGCRAGAAEAAGGAGAAGATGAAGAAGSAGAAGAAGAAGDEAGVTYKEWEGLWHALFTAPVKERFGVNFGKSLTVEEKALLLAATLLLDYMYFDV